MKEVDFNLMAVGGDLSPGNLLRQYRRGNFPWSVDPVTWWSPDPRAVIEVGEPHIPRSLAKFMRKCGFRKTMNQAFREVMLACAAPRASSPGTWISTPFLEGYGKLHELGHAHSLEVWEGENLVGGIYGVAIGGYFAGESMFHRRDNASKVALIWLLEHLRERGFSLFDTQTPTPATLALGARLIPRGIFLARLEEAVALPARIDG